MNEPVRAYSLTADQPVSRVMRGIQNTLIRKERESGLERHEFLQKVGLPQSSYYAILSNRANLKTTAIEDIAERLGISVWALIGVPPDLEHILDEATAVSEPRQAPLGARGARSRKKTLGARSAVK